MQIYNQVAGRDIRNVEISSQFAEADLWRRLEEIEIAVRDAVESGELDRHYSASLEAAEREVTAAAKDPQHDPSRLLRALEVLKGISGAASAAAGVAEVVDKLINTMTGT